MRRTPTSEPAQVANAVEKLYILAIKLKGDVIEAMLVGDCGLDGVD